MARNESHHRQEQVLSYSPEPNAPHPHRNHPPTQYLVKNYPKWFIVGGVAGVFLFVLLWIWLTSG